MMVAAYGDSGRTGLFRVSGVDKPSRVEYHVDAGNPIFGRPLLDGDLLFLGGVNGVVTAVDTDSGEIRWQQQVRVVRPIPDDWVDPNPDEWDYGYEPHEWLAEPFAVVAGRLFVRVEVSDEAPYLVAVDRYDGKLVGEVADGEPGAHPATLLMLDTLRGVEPRELRTRWWPRLPRFSGDTDTALLQAPPAVVEGLVVASAAPGADGRHGGLHAFDQVTGDQVWGIGVTADAEGDPLRVYPVHPAVADGTVWIPRWRGESTEIVGYDLHTGTLRHVYAPDRGERWRASGAVAVAGGLVYAVLTNGAPLPENEFHPAELHAINAATGELLWVSPVGLTVLGSPVLAGGQVLLAGQDHRPGYDDWVCGLDARTGALWWAVNAEAEVGVDPCWLPDGAKEMPTALLPGEGVLYGQTRTGLFVLE